MRSLVPRFSAAAALTIPGSERVEGTMLRPACCGRACSEGIRRVTAAATGTSNFQSLMQPGDKVRANLSEQIWRLRFYYCGAIDETAIMHRNERMPMLLNTSVLFTMIDWRL
jgi:hypothetical protein